MAKNYLVSVEFQMEVEADSPEEAGEMVVDLAPINCVDNYVTEVKFLYDDDEAEEYNRPKARVLQLVKG